MYTVQASGQGKTWVTSSGAATALLGFVQSFTYTSGQNVITVKDNAGVPDHHKVVGKNEISLSFNMLLAATANIPAPASGSGASVPMLHLEYKMNVPEDAAMTGHYYNFMGVPIESMQFSTDDNGNTLQFTCRALAMSGVNPSGKIA